MQALINAASNLATELSVKITPRGVLTIAAGAVAIIIIIPPLRKFTYAMLTSKELAITYLRSKITNLLSMVVAINGVVRILVWFFPWLVQGLPQWVQDWVKNDLKLLVVCTLAFVAWNYIEYAYRALVMRWRQILMPKPVSSKPFYGTQIMITTNAAGDKFFTPSLDGITPGVPVQMAINQAMSFYGMTFPSYLYNTITIGMIEYPRNIFNRIFRHYGGLEPQCNMVTTPRNFYEGMINTSMACWMNGKTGNLDFWNLRLTFNETDTLILEHVCIFLDHDKKEFVKMTAKSQGVESLLEPEQASILAQCIFAIYTHPQVHWWANGATQLEKKWKCGKESSNVTQWMNMASTYISPIFIGNTAATMAGIIADNLNGGLPFHFSELEVQVSANSKAHQIGKKCRELMKTQFPEYSEAEVNSLMASTVYHSSDHYYTTVYMSWASQSKYLIKDNSLLRMALFAPNKYYTRKLLCRERQDDPICKMIYEVALTIDPKFANTALFFACAN
jgi:hypothetical protein